MDVLYTSECTEGAMQERRCDVQRKGDWAEIKSLRPRWFKQETTHLMSAKSPMFLISQRLEYEEEEKKKSHSKALDTTYELKRESWRDDFS